MTTNPNLDDVKRKRDKKWKIAHGALLVLMWGVLCWSLGHRMGHSSAMTFMTALYADCYKDKP